MQAIVTTTIKTAIDIDSFEPTHDVHIECTDGLPRELVLAAAEGALKTALAEISSRNAGRG